MSSSAGEEGPERKLNPCNVACSCFCRSAVQIIQVEDIPYTVNMKRVEVPVKKVGVSQLCVLPGEPTQLGGCLGSGLDGGARKQKRVC